MHARHQALEADLPVAVPVGEVIDLGNGESTRVRVMDAVGVPARSPLVLLHGLTASAGINWVHCYGAYNTDRHVIAPDLRGHADGPRARRIDTIETYAADVLAMLDVLGVDRFTLLGFSMGGGVAQAVARQSLERLDGVVFASTGPRFRIAPITKRLYGANAIAAKLAARLPEDVRDKLLPKFVKHPDANVRRFIQHESAKHSARGLVRCADALGRFRPAKWLDELHVPATVLVASNDSSLDPRMQRRLAELLPDAEQVEVATGHADIVWNHENAIQAFVSAVDSTEARSARR